MLERLQVEEATNVSEPDVVATGAQAPPVCHYSECVHVYVCVCVCSRV